MGAAFFPDGKTLASAGIDGAIKLWSPTARRELNNRIPLTNVIGSSLSPDCMRFVAWDREGRCRIWNVPTLAEIASLALNDTNVSDVALSPGGQFLAATTAQDGVNILEVADQRRIAFGSADFALTDLRYSPDGVWLAGGGGDERVVVWNIPARQRAFSASRAAGSGNADFRGAMVFSPDSRLLATGGKDGQITLWSIDEGQQILEIAAHQSRVYAIGFSPDGTRLASGGYDGATKLWDVKTGRQTGRLLGQLLPARSFGFSREGRRLAAGFNDGTVKLWDLATGREVIAFPGPDRVFRGTAFLDEDTLVSMEGFSLVVWRAATRAEVDAAEVRQ